MSASDPGDDSGPELGDPGDWDCPPGPGGTACRIESESESPILAMLAAALGFGTGQIAGALEFLVAFADDPLGMLTGPLTDFWVDSMFGMFEWIFGFLYSVAGLFVDILRQSMIDPIGNVYVAITWPFVTFIDGYYAMAVSSAEGAGPFAPVIVVMFFLALMVVVYFVVVALATLLSIVIGVRLDKLALSLWKRTSRLTGQVLPLPSRLERGGGDR